MPILEKDLTPIDYKIFDYVYKNLHSWNIYGVPYVKITYRFRRYPSTNARLDMLMYEIDNSNQLKNIDNNCYIGFFKNKYIIENNRKIPNPITIDGECYLNDKWIIALDNYKFQLKLKRKEKFKYIIVTALVTGIMGFVLNEILRRI